MVRQDGPKSRTNGWTNGPRGPRPTRLSDADGKKQKQPVTLVRLYDVPILAFRLITNYFVICGKGGSRLGIEYYTYLLFSL